MKNTILNTRAWRERCSLRQANPMVFAATVSDIM
jgi:hypothetical protein